MSPRNRIILGDARTILNELPAGYVDCVVTSPPYFRLRNYQHPRQLGLEQHVDEWVANLRRILQSIERVLTPSGSVWLNLGDSYSTGQEGAAAKSLLLGPERLALALTRDGWLIRNKIVWAKPNPLPSAVHDRLTCSWEVVYFLTRNRRYFFDLDAIRQPHTSRKKPSASGRGWSVPPPWRVTPTTHSGLAALAAAGRVGHPLGKNPVDVWPLATAAYRGPHHAVFPLALAERPILAGSPQRRCSRCRAPWTREKYRRLGQLALLGQLRPTCACTAGAEPGVVLDPFIGSGTTAIAAERHGRDWIGIELNPDFARLAEQRIETARTANGKRRAA